MKGKLVPPFPWRAGFFSEKKTFKIELPEDNLWNNSPPQMQSKQIWNAREMVHRYQFFKSYERKYTTFIQQERAQTTIHVQQKWPENFRSNKGCSYFPEQSSYDKKAFHTYPAHQTKRQIVTPVASLLKERKSDQQTKPVVVEEKKPSQPSQFRKMAAGIDLKDGNPLNPHIEAMISELEETEKEYMKLAEIPEIKQYLKEVEALEEKVQEKWDKFKFILSSLTIRIFTEQGSNATLVSEYHKEMNDAFDIAVKKHFDVNPEEYLMYKQGKLAQATEMIEKRRAKEREEKKKRSEEVQKMAESKQDELSQLNRKKLKSSSENE